MKVLSGLRRLNLAKCVYVLGLVCAFLCGYLSPLPCLGFGFLAAGLIWAAYDLVEVPDGDTPRPPR